PWPTVLPDTPTTAMARGANSGPKRSRTPPSSAVSALIAEPCRQYESRVDGDCAVLGDDHGIQVDLVQLLVELHQKATRTTNSHQEVNDTLLVDLETSARTRKHGRPS